MKNTWSLRGIVLLVPVLTLSCASHPPSDLITLDDHARLTTWYEQEAVRLRDKAEEMRQMAAEYAKPSYQPAPKESKLQLMAHCDLFIKYYTQAAEEAEALAKLHREQDKAIP